MSFHKKTAISREVRAAEGLRVDIRSISSWVSKPRISANASISACPVKRSRSRLLGACGIDGMFE